MKNRGKRLVHIYTGSGKGKTCSAIGLAVRALGRGWKVLIIRFMKSKMQSGEDEILTRIPGCEILWFGKPGFVEKGKTSIEDQHLAENGMAVAEKEIQSGNWDCVILDEIFPAIDVGLIPLERLKSCIEKKSHKTELVLTGRNAPEFIYEFADLVSEIKEIKHPYQRGIKARYGIEY